jgi:hypothetical protein
MLSLHCTEDSCSWRWSFSPRNKSVGRGCARLFRPMVPDFLHGAPPTDACAVFIKESRMEFVNAKELDRKSGCTLRRTWGTRPGMRASFFGPTGPAPTNATAPSLAGARWGGRKRGRLKADAGWFEQLRLLRCTARHTRWLLPLARLPCGPRALFSPVDPLQ